MINRFYSVFSFCLLSLGVTFSFLSQQVLAKKGFSIERLLRLIVSNAMERKEKVKGDVNLISYTKGGDIKENPELLQMVLEVIDFGEMPPEENNPIPQDQKVIVLELKKMLKESVITKEEVVRSADS